MDTSKNSLNKLKLNRKQLIGLFKLSLTFAEMARHDLNSLTSALSGISENLRVRLNRPDLASSVNDMKLMVDDLKAISSAIASETKVVFEPYRELDLDEHFITSPLRVVDEIAARIKYPKVVVGTASSESLRIVFPGNILYGILSELTRNARAQLGKQGTVVIRWQMKGKKFQCEVHDNGPGMIHGTNQKFLPLDSLPVSIRRKKDRSGLHIIDRIVRRANGLLLFGRSQELGGTLVLFEVPLLGYWDDNA